ncbi:hypothetical protein BaRGS_00027381 [Batillaria attramentaria]|uniref:Vacuolar ATPase assembly protein VMA22 n=1 Tax=Batillaria attramentaria TaxID=370345 RepID=A0ABD0K352_9CAEN
METDKKKVKESLDNVVLEFFDVLQSLYQQQASLERMMRDGFLSLSRARYSMGGTRNVGALQFAENELELHPVVEVEVEASSTTGKEDEADSDDGGLSISMKVVDNRRAGSNKTESQKDSDKDNIRRRNLKKTNADTVENVGQQKEMDSKTEQPNSTGECGVKDPLRLFGVLVSPHLRQSQASFRQAVDTTVHIANLKHKLCSLKKEYLDLMTQKKALESS